MRRCLCVSLACAAGTYSPQGSPCQGMRIEPPIAIHCSYSSYCSWLVLTGPNFCNRVLFNAPNLKPGKVCPSGTYSGASASTCPSCPGFSTSTSNSSTCACNAGYSTSGFGSTLTCSGNAGRSRNRRTSQCPDAHAGRQQSFEACQCIVCPKNTYNVDGITCITCPTGSSTSGTGATTCTCQNGYSSSGTSTTLQCTGRASLVKGDRVSSRLQNGRPARCCTFQHVVSLLCWILRCFRRLCLLT